MELSRNLAKTILEPRYWPVSAMGISAAALAMAHISETFFGLEPCPLCLTQRAVYWLAIGIGIAGLVAMRTRLVPLSVLCLVLGLVHLSGAGIAAFHAGVEWGIFPAPDTCQGGTGSFGVIDPETLSRPMRVVSCADAPFRFFGLSMAGWNALFSLGLAGAGFRGAIGARR